jgi:hypothetical protein
MPVEAEEISQMCRFPSYFCYPVRIIPGGLVELWHFSLTLRLSTAETRLRNANRKLRKLQHIQDSSIFEHSVSRECVASVRLVYQRSSQDGLRRFAL